LGVHDPSAALDAMGAAAPGAHSFLGQKICRKLQKLYALSAAISRKLYQKCHNRINMNLSLFLKKNTDSIFKQLSKARILAKAPWHTLTLV